MRTGQNKRMRGRNTNNGGNNRKGPNPLTRSYESNGPDVKIRGTPHHVAEKYLQLARDAQTSGDPVMAESYLQHAEHYFRIIAAAQQAQIQAQTGQPRQPGDGDGDDGDDDDDIGGLPDRFASPIERQPQPMAQPVPFAPPQPQPQAAGVPNANGQNRQNYNGDRNSGERFNERGPRADRPYQERGERDNRQQRDFRNRDQQRPFRDQNYAPQPSTERDVRPAQDQPEGGPGLPAFITAPVRVNPPAESGGIADQANARSPTTGDDEDAGQFHLRSRRRRRPVAEAEDGAAEGDSPKSSTPAAD